ncbi:MAG: Gmad2 immunoglobulin-like domain-containing protein [bacterium]|nr:Gmad2 immunoglobulin-like domain-containing protein [bacterium]
MNKNLLTVSLLIIVLGLVAIFAYQNFFPSKDSEKGQKPAAEISTFEQCAAAGMPVQESYPRRCMAEGKSFTEDIGNTLEKSDFIVLKSPLPNEKVGSPLQITGQAKGSWFFEAVFPVKILNSADKVLGTTTAKTSDNWMSDSFVTFNATLTFEASTTERGTLVLEKDNPSGLVENEDSLRIPIKFK